MAIIESASRDALFVITILRLIPRNKWISTTEIKQALEELGYSVEPRRLQRILRDIHKCDDLYVECTTSGKPYGYRRRMPDSDLAADKLRAPESLLLRLAEEHLKYQQPSSIMKTLAPLFDSARRSLKEEGTSARQSAWMQKNSAEAEQFQAKLNRLRESLDGLSSVQGLISLGGKLSAASSGSAGNEMFACAA